jgi:hypothetical protein
MAAFYRVPLSEWRPTRGRRAAMRRRLNGTDVPPGRPLTVVWRVNVVPDPDGELHDRQLAEILKLLRRARELEKRAKE